VTSGVLLLSAFCSGLVIEKSNMYATDAHFGMACRVATTLISLVITHMNTALAGNLTHPSGARTGSRGQKAGGGWAVFVSLVWQPTAPI